MQNTFSKKMLIVFFVVVAAPFSQAKVLSCWNVYSKATQKPVIWAQIINHDKLSSVKISDVITNSLVKDPSVKGTVKSERIYKSNKIVKDQRQFKLSKEAQLILPPSLESKRLQASRLEERSGRKINGLLLLKNDKSNASFSIKLFCQSI